MLASYFTKVEDRFVFNVSLIFWHLLVLIAAIAIAVGIGMYIWGMMPASKPDVMEQAYPEKATYPDPVKVTLEELNKELRQHVDLAATQSPSVTEPQQEAPAAGPADPEVDYRGLTDYENAIIKLKELIPPATYSWAGQGHYIYPQGQRYWDFYKQERYRQWIVTAPGFEDALNKALTKSKAMDYSAKHQIINSLNSIAGVLPESERMRVISDVLKKFSDNTSTNARNNQLLAGAITLIGDVGEYGYVRSLAEFGSFNPADLEEMTKYLGNSLPRFATVDRIAVLNRIIESYYRIFNRNIGQLKESTDMFLQLMEGIDPSLRVQAITEYHSLYLNKNQRRNLQMAQIDQEHKTKLAQIDAANHLAHMKAEAAYLAEQHRKEASRGESVYAVGGGILAVIVIATILVFFSIQRLVKRIEAQMNTRTAPVSHA